MVSLKSILLGGIVFGWPFVASAYCPPIPSGTRSDLASFQSFCSSKGGQIKDGYRGPNAVYFGTLACVCPTTAAGASGGTQAWSNEAFVRNLGRLFTDPFGARARAAASGRSRASERATSLNEEGIAAYNVRDYARARDKFAAALRIENDPVIRRNLANAWRGIAWKHQQTLDYAGALRALREAVTVDPSLTDLRRALDELERQYAEHLAAVGRRESEETAAAIERDRLRNLAMRLADSLRAATGASNTSGLIFMDGSAPLSREGADASVVDLRDKSDRPLVVDPRVFSNNPAVQREQALLEQNPIEWYAAAEQRVRGAVANNQEWAQVLLRAMREGPSSTTARYANWATFAESGLDPALDSALLSAVKQAYPELADEDPRRLRAIAEAHITPFLIGRAGPEPRYDAALTSDDLLPLFQGAAQNPVSQRTNADAALSEAIVERIATEEAQANPPPAFMPLSGLNPGDVVLVAPVSEQRDVAGAVSGGAIQAGDYLRRVATDFAEGGLARAAATEAQPASHALAFVGVVDGRMLFLNHNPGRPSEIVDYRQVLVEYGGREMFVARPQLPVDGRALWQAAQDQVDYGVVGDRVVCSERVGLAIARATGTTLTNDRLGPLDITPGDFFDRENNVGKHFVVTRLRITGVPRRN